MDETYTPVLRGRRDYFFETAPSPQDGAALGTAGDRHGNQYVRPVAVGHWSLNGQCSNANPSRFVPPVDGATLLLTSVKLSVNADTAAILGGAGEEVYISYVDNLTLGTDIEIIAEWPLGSQAIGEVLHIPPLMDFNGLPITVVGGNAVGMKIPSYEGLPLKVRLLGTANGVYCNFTLAGLILRDQPIYGGSAD